MQLTFVLEQSFLRQINDSTSKMTNDDQSLSTNRSGVKEIVIVKTESEYVCTRTFSIITGSSRGRHLAMSRIQLDKDMAESFKNRTRQNINRYSIN